MREFVPGAGPAIGGENSARLEGLRQSTNAAPAAPAPAASTRIFGVGEVTSVRTRAANEQVRATLSITRQNNALDGSGSYQFTVDDVAVGISRRGPVGTDQQAVTIDTLLTIAAPGVHTIGAQVTSNIGTETVSANGSLVVEANEFTTA